MVFHEWPLVKDTDKTDKRLESFRDAMVGGGGEKVPGRSEHDFADNIGGEVVACND